MKRRGSNRRQAMNNDSSQVPGDSNENLPVPIDLCSSPSSPISRLSDSSSECGSPVVKRHRKTKRKVLDPSQIESSENVQVYSSLAKISFQKIYSNPACLPLPSSDDIKSSTDETKSTSHEAGDTTPRSPATPTTTAADTIGSDSPSLTPPPPPRPHRSCCSQTRDLPHRAELNRNLNRIASNIRKLDAFLKADDDTTNNNNNNKININPTTARGRNTRSSTAAAAASSSSSSSASSSSWSASAAGRGHSRGRRRGRRSTRNSNRGRNPAASRGGGGDVIVIGDDDDDDDGYGGVGYGGVGYGGGGGVVGAGRGGGVGGGGDVVCINDDDDDDDDDADNKIVFMVKVNLKIKRYEMKYNDSFCRLFAELSSSLEVSEDSLMLLYNDSTVHQNESPAAIKMRAYDSLVCLVTTETEESCDSNMVTRSGSDIVQLVIQCNNSKKSNVNMSVGKYETIQSLIDVYRKQQDLKVETVRIYFDGELLNPTHTPAAYDIEDGDCLDLVLS
ncbi:NFATC2-interacting protein-like [Argonauta hians]